MSEADWLRSIDVGRALALLGVEATLVGDQWKAHCPNSKLGHPKGDRHPSWAIRDNPEHDRHGVHGCWSCSYRGTIVNLVRDLMHLPSNDEGMDQAEAWLKEHARLDEREAPSSVVIEIEEEGSAATVPRGVRFDPLCEWVTPARRYLTGRGFNDDDVAEWGLGWAAEGRCAGRIFIPIFDRGGKLASWNSRSFDGRDPKYLRASHGDTVVMFGEHRWPVLTQRDWLIVSEGEFNVIAAHRILGDGAASFGAMSGNKMMRERQMLRLVSFRSVLVLADPDSAGEELLQSIGDAHEDVFVARLPEGTDAAKLLETGQPEVLRDAVQLAQRWTR